MENDKDELSNAVYLGDGLYYSFDAYEVRLFTHNGIYSDNEVFLEPAVLKAFLYQLKKTGIID